MFPYLLQINGLTFIQPIISSTSELNCSIYRVGTGQWFNLWFISYRVGWESLRTEQCNDGRDETELQHGQT